MHYLKKYFLFILYTPALMACSNPDIEKIQESEEVNFEIDTVVTGLSIPWGMVWLPSGEMLITERGGEIRIFKDGALLEDRISGLPTIYVHGQGGLLDIELHPDYTSTGWVYISYSSGEGSSPNSGNTTLMRARLDGYQLVDKEVIFKAEPNTSKSQHFGGRIEFDRDGFLYLSIGDRGERNKAQDITTYNGSVFRLNDDGSIPSDNPFVSDNKAIGAIYSYGHRNPQGLAINPETGEIWSHEHGPKGGDEVNIIRKGNNYGWPEITYGVNYSGTTISEFTHKEGMEQPVTYWDPSIAPCGMTFVSGDKYPGWKGDLLVGSLKFNYIVRCDVNGNEIDSEEILLDRIGRVRVIRQGPDGLIYIALEGKGLIIRLMPL